MGHAQPFRLRFVEVGNEEVDHPTGSYAKHFKILADALQNERRRQQWQQRRQMQQQEEEEVGGVGEGGEGPSASR